MFSVFLVLIYAAFPITAGIFIIGIKKLFLTLKERIRKDEKNCCYQR